VLPEAPARQGRAGTASRAREGLARLKIQLLDHRVYGREAVRELVHHARVYNVQREALMCGRVGERTEPQKEHAERRLHDEVGGINLKRQHPPSA